MHHKIDPITAIKRTRRVCLTLCARDLVSAWSGPRWEQIDRAKNSPGIHNTCPPSAHNPNSMDCCLTKTVTSFKQRETTWPLMQSRQKKLSWPEGMKCIDDTRKNHTAPKAANGPNNSLLFLAFGVMSVFRETFFFCRSTKAIFSSKYFNPRIFFSCKKNPRTETFLEKYCFYDTTKTFHESILL